MYRVNYFDLGTHSGLEILYLMSQVLLPAANQTATGPIKEPINYKIYGFDACSQAATALQQDINNLPIEVRKNITIINKAI